AKEFELSEMLVNDESLSTAKKGDSCTIPTPFRVRPSDKLYKIVAS
ncbi:MAG TPA: collagenase-like protease, partial [Aequorivita sp.]|nr:collagenase-like protease [Aequorivita sp.]